MHPNSIKGRYVVMHGYLCTPPSNGAATGSLMRFSENTIAALSTPPGAGAIGMIRLSGVAAISIADTIFKGKKLAEQASHTLHFGSVVNRELLVVGHRSLVIEHNPTTHDSRPMTDDLRPTTHDSRPTTDEIIDEVVVGLFRAPHSYTGEDVVEISCHGSPYILQRVMEVCIEAGAVPAAAGEFTQRAFLNGKLDLTQAEAVGDLIAAESKAAQQSAMHQLRGGFSTALKAMREELITFSALIELELDFSQEDVTFADRAQLHALLDRISLSTNQLISSFRLGNAVKNGVSVAIIGAPNVGKSTLLNALLHEERAIVSEIAGTTRDTIEELMNIDGILFRFIDTAGIRAHTDDLIEQQGIARSRKKAEEANVVIRLSDVGEIRDSGAAAQHSNAAGDPQDRQHITVINKADLLQDASELQAAYPAAIFISARDGKGVDKLKDHLRSMVVSATVQPGDTIITNTRHLAALQKIAAAVADIKAGLNDDIPGDLIALDIRQALHYIGELTGQVQTDRDVLGAIFGKFCIGK